MKRIWFNPNIITMTDGAKYYFRINGGEWFPFMGAFDLATNTLQIAFSGDIISVLNVLRVSPK